MTVSESLGRRCAYVAAIYVTTYMYIYPKKSSLVTLPYLINE